MSVVNSSGFFSIKLNVKPNRAIKIEWEKVNFNEHTSVSSPAPLIYNRFFFLNDFQMKCSFARDIFCTVQFIMHCKTWDFYPKNGKTAAFVKRCGFWKKWDIYCLCILLASWIVWHLTVILKALSWCRQHKRTAHIAAVWIKVYQNVIKIRCATKKRVYNFFWI